MRSNRTMILIIFLLLPSGGTYFFFLQPRSECSPAGFRTIVMFRDDDMQPFYRLKELERVNRIFQEASVPVTLSIIPNFQGKYPLDKDMELVDHLRQILGENGSLFEPALHGYTHLNLTTDGWGDSEFRGLPLDKQIEFIQKGLGILRSTLQMQSITTFVPPFDTYDNNTLIALRNQGFTAISTEARLTWAWYRTGQPLSLDDLVIVTQTQDQMNWTSNNFFPLSQVEEHFDNDYYQKPGGAYMFLIHYFLFTSEDRLQYLQSFISFVKSHSGVKFMTIRQFANLTTNGMRQGQSGWESCKSTPKTTTTSVRTPASTSSFPTTSLIVTSTLQYPWQGWIELLVTAVVIVLLGSILALRKRGKKS